MISKIKILQILIVSLLVTFAACGEDSRMHNMVDDSIYVLNPGLNEVDVFNWGNYDYNFVVIKSGSGQQSSEVELVVDEQYIAEYNTAHGTSYKLLPEQYYTIHANRMSVGKDDYRIYFPITFDSDAIIELQGKHTSEYVLPCRINVKNTDIQSEDPEKLYSIIVPTVWEPYLEYKAWGLTSPAISLDPESADRIVASSKIITNYNNKWNLDFTLEVDPQALADYNSENGTNYILLPEAAYEFDQTSWKIPANMNEVSAKFNILKEGLKNGETFLFGEYVLPVRIASVSEHEINPEKAVQLITVSFQPKALDRVGWEIIDYSDQREDDGGGVNAVLDGDVTTFWHSYWGDPENTPLPHWIIIDMKQEYNIMSIEIIRRVSGMTTDTKTIEFEVSSDNESYEYAGKIDFGTPEEFDGTTKQVNLASVKTGRYLKVTVTESNRSPFSAIAEVYVKGTE